MSKPEDRQILGADYLKITAGPGLTCGYINQTGDGSTCNSLPPHYILCPPPVNSTLILALYSFAVIKGAHTTSDWIEVLR
jgi:hypothetical protein